jgi:hypothetical protein
MSVVSASPAGSPIIVVSLFPVLSSVTWALLLVTATVKAVWPGANNYSVEEASARGVADGG